MNIRKNNGQRMMMKIKFLKDYAINRGACPLNIGGFDMLETEIIKANTVVDLEKDNRDGAFSDELVKWLIDNSFAEEAQESGWWKPEYGERYYHLGSDGCVYNNQWENDSFDKARLKFGSFFKTEEATERYRDYQIAVATVRQDEGVLTTDDVRKTLARDGTVYTIGINVTMLSVNRFYNTSAGAIYFDTGYHAKSSLDNHADEWKIIADYDWSRE